MELPIFYCDNKNFGDILNCEIFKKYLNVDLAVTGVDRAEVLGIGSLLECILQENKEVHEIIQKPIRIFSTGFGFAEGQHPRRCAVQPERSIRKIECYAVRGKLSLERLKKMTGDSLDKVVIADGGLLAACLLEGKEVKEKKYRLGIVPHMADKDDGLWKKIEGQISSSKIIDVTQEPKKVLEELSQCETVVSSGLHPLIACDSMGIPNAWVKVSDMPSDYKFKDYYSAFNVEREPYVKETICIQDELVEEIKKNYNIPMQLVEEKKQQLLRALEEMKRDLENKNGIVSKKNSFKTFLSSVYMKYFYKNPGERVCFKSSDRILVVAPHPDDESIGCGGLLLNYGKQCDVLLLTDGQKSRPKKEWTQEYVVALRKKEFEAAMDSVSVNKKIYVHWNDGRTKIEKPKLEIPLKGVYDYVFVPNPYEKHPDHQYANQAVKDAVKRQRAKCKIMEYEVWATIPTPTHYMSIDMERKSRLIENHQSQLMHINYVERIRGLNFYRGMLFQTQYAECYQLAERNSLDKKIMRCLYAFYCKLLSR